MTNSNFDATGVKSNSGATFSFSRHFEFRKCQQRKPPSIMIMLKRSRTTIELLRAMGSRPMSTLISSRQAVSRKKAVFLRPSYVPCARVQSFGRRFHSTAAVAETIESRRTKTTAPITPENPFIPLPERKYQFFKNVEITDSGVAMVRFDSLGKSVNAISFALADEAKELWTTEIGNNENVKAVVFMSAKPDTFIVGADIYDIKRTENKQDLIPVIEGGLKLFQRIRSKGVPLVAAIDGPALGGGLEWCLWCDYRICTDSPKTKVSRYKRCTERSTDFFKLTYLFFSISLDGTP